MSAKNHFIPSITDFDEKGMKQNYDVFSRLLKDRIIFLNGPIDDSLALSITTQLLVLDRDSEKDIHLYISSPGGSVYDMLTIIDVMSTIRSKISTIGFGLVASAASVILACGTKGLRFCTNSTRIMIHQPSGGARGQVTDMQIQIKEAIFLKEQINDIMMKRLNNITKKQLERLMERDYFMCAKEALNLGIIDNIYLGDLDKINKIGLIK